MAFGRRKSKIEGSQSAGADDASAVSLERKPSRFSLFGGRNKKNKQPATTAPVQDRDEVDEDDLCFTDGNQSASVSTAFKNRKNQKKIVYDHFGDIAKDVLMTWSTSEIPKAENMYDVVVKIEATTVSLNDCILRRGMDFSVTDPVSLPATPGGDFVGSIVSVGKGVTAWKEGDRVAALVRTGGNARYMVLSQDSLVAVPRSVESCEAVAMVSTYMTAYQSLQKALGKSKSFAGKAVLVTGGIGPVGQALIQLSFRAGADIVFCTAPDNRHRYVKSVLGAKPLPMEPSKWLPLLEGKIDVVFDSACQDGFDSPQKALNSNGKLICLGMYSLLQQETMGAFGAPMSAFWAKTKAQYLMGNTQFYEVWESFQSDPKKFKSDLEEVFYLLSKREIKPHIAKRISLGDVPDAQTFLESGQARGVIVCMPWRRRKGNVPAAGTESGRDKPADE